MHQVAAATLTGLEGPSEISNRNNTRGGEGEKYVRENDGRKSVGEGGGGEEEDGGEARRGVRDDELSDSSEEEDDETEGDDLSDDEIGVFIKSSDAHLHSIFKLCQIDRKRIKDDFNAIRRTAVVS